MLLYVLSFVGLKQSGGSIQIYCRGNIDLQAAAGGFYVGTCGFECVQYTGCSRRLALTLLTPVHSSMLFCRFPYCPEDKQNGAACSELGGKITVSMIQRWVCYTDQKRDCLTSLEAQPEICLSDFRSYFNI